MRIDQAWDNSPTTNVDYLGGFVDEATDLLVGTHREDPIASNSESLLIVR